MADVHYDLPVYYPDESDELIKCDCHHLCNHFKPNEVVRGHGDDMLAIIHKEAYLDNFKSDLSNEDYELLTKKIEKQCQTKNH